MARWYYRYEAKGIQDYVLGTSRLREITGASELVESLSTDAARWCEKLGGELLVSAAGGATVAFEDEKDVPQRRTARNH